MDEPDEQSLSPPLTSKNHDNNANENEDSNEDSKPSGSGGRSSRSSLHSGVISGRVSSVGSGSRRLPHRDYTPEQRRQLLKRALDDVITYGISVRLAAESHGVAKSSLSDYIRKQNVLLPGAARKQAVRQQLRASIAADGAASIASEPSPVSAMTAPSAAVHWSLASLPTLVPWQPPASSRLCDSAGVVDNASYTTSGISTLIHSQSELLGGARNNGGFSVKQEAADAIQDAHYVADKSYNNCNCDLSRVKIHMATGDLSQQLCHFVNRSPSPFHAVAESKRMLDAAGFTHLREDQPWNVKPNQRYYVTRNGSTLFAFAVGGSWKPGNGFSLIGAHTDSPCLRIKPVSHRDAAGDVQQCGVETYGGGLWYTWFDRDLTAAGRVIVRSTDPATGETTSLSERLVNLEAPIFKVPSLAIHLDRTANDGFAPNKENHLSPILCQKVLDQAQPAPATQPRHPPGLVARVAQALGCKPEDIVDWELCLADTQPAQVTGLNGEFLSSPRLDNLLSCFGALTALIEAPGLESDPNCRVICLYDHEEIGSASAQGAGSAITHHLLQRLCSGGGTPGDTLFEQSMPQSMLVSADVAHAVHPNYEEKHEKRHRPSLFGGLVVKTNSNQRYATNARTGTLLRECLRRGYPDGPGLQDFVIRQDAACGSTIGPILAAGLGMPTVDVGAPVLAMHSCRETGAAVSPGQCARLFISFFRHFPALRDALKSE